MTGAGGCIDSGRVIARRSFTTHIVSPNRCMVAGPVSPIGGECGGRMREALRRLGATPLTCRQVINVRCALGDVSAL